MWIVIAWVAFGFGVLLCIGNFYISFVGYALHRMLGKPAETYHGASGIPLLGSLFVAVSLIFLHTYPWVWPIAVVSIVLDTGGIHWLLVWQMLPFNERPDEGEE